MPIDKNGALNISCDKTPLDEVSLTPCQAGLFINAVSPEAGADVDDLYANVLIGKDKVREIYDFLGEYLGVSK